MTLLAKVNRKAGVDKRLLDCMVHAAETCPLDIVLLEGVRSVMRQSELVAAGASQTGSDSDRHVYWSEPGRPNSGACAPGAATSTSVMSPGVVAG